MNKLQHYNKNQQILFFQIQTIQLLEIMTIGRITILVVLLVATESLRMSDQHNVLGLPQTTQLNHLQQTKILYRSNLVNNNWYYGKLTQQQYRVKLFELQNKHSLIPCPKQTPYASFKDLTKCFKCEGDKPLFNFQTGLCQPCAENYHFSQKIGNCTFITIQNGNKFAQKSNNAQKTNTEQSNKCPFDRPLSQGTDCKPCQKGKLYDSVNNKCIEHCQQQKIYDEPLRKCITATFLTSPYSQNLVSVVKDFEQFKKQTEIKKKDKPFSRYCGQDKPFLSEGKCITCPVQKPLFNIDLMKCVDCSLGRSYDANTHKCNTPINIASSIERMIINII